MQFPVGRAAILRYGVLIISLWLSACPAQSQILDGQPALKPRQVAELLDAARHPLKFGYRVVATFPHDPRAFTQGLVYHQGQLYESTGLHGRSTVRRVETATGRVIQQHPLEHRYFGEGLAHYDHRLYQLTWKSGTGFIYDRQTLKPLGTFFYDTEGWGLTQNGLLFIQSDGTDRLYFRTLDTFQPHHTIQVRDGAQPITRINELEFIHGRIWANIWHSQRIAIINPASGRVAGWVDLSGLAPQAADGQPGSVLNGIAHDPGEDRLLVTGKRWSRIFEVELVPLTAED